MIPINKVRDLINKHISLIEQKILFDFRFMISSWSNAMLEFPAKGKAFFMPISCLA